jgi:hypothetical protein
MRRVNIFKGKKLKSIEKNLLNNFSNINVDIFEVQGLNSSLKWSTSKKRLKNLPFSKKKENKKSYKTWSLQWIYFRKFLVKTNKIFLVHLGFGILNVNVRRLTFVVEGIPWPNISASDFEVSFMFTIEQRETWRACPSSSTAVSNIVFNLWDFRMFWVISLNNTTLLYCALKNLNKLKNIWNFEKCLPEVWVRHFSFLWFLVQVV